MVSFGTRTPVPDMIAVVVPFDSNNVTYNKLIMNMNNMANMVLLISDRQPFLMYYT